MSAPTLSTNAASVVGSSAVTPFTRHEFVSVPGSTGFYMFCPDLPQGLQHFARQHPGYRSKPKRDWMPTTETSLMTAEQFRARSKTEDIVAITFDKERTDHGGYNMCMSEKPVHNVWGLLGQAARSLHEDPTPEWADEMDPRSKLNFATALVSVANSIAPGAAIDTYQPILTSASMEKNEFDKAVNGGAALFKAWPKSKETKACWSTAARR